jgi:hypothetical protein
MKFIVKILKKGLRLYRGLVYPKGDRMAEDNNVKEYVLRIVYNVKTGEIEHLSEYGDIGYSLDVAGETLTIPDEMGKFLEEQVDSSVLGIT